MGANRPNYPEKLDELIDLFAGRQRRYGLAGLVSQIKRAVAAL